MNYLTIKEAMEIYSASENTLRRWIKEGKVKGIQIGRKWLIEPDNNTQNEQILRMMVENTLKDFGNELLDSCTYIGRDDELEFRIAEFEKQIDLYAKQIVNLMSLKEGDK